MTDIFEAVENGDIALVKYLLNSNPVLLKEFDASSGQTLLFIPAANGDLEMARFLISKSHIKLRIRPHNFNLKIKVGAQIDFLKRDIWGRNAYDVAILSNNYEISTLIRREISPRGIDSTVDLNLIINNRYYRWFPLSESLNEYAKNIINSGSVKAFIAVDGVGVFILRSYFGRYFWNTYCFLKPLITSFIGTYYFIFSLVDIFRELLYYYFQYILNYVYNFIKRIGINAVVLVSSLKNYSKFVTNILNFIFKSQK